MRLDPSEIAHYHREGWVVPHFRLPADEIKRMLDALDALIRANPGVRPEKLVSAHVEGDNGAERSRTLGAAAGAAASAAGEVSVSRTVVARVSGAPAGGS